MNIKLIIIGAIGLLMAPIWAQAKVKNFQYFCQSNGWYAPTSAATAYYHFFVKTTDCQNVEKKLALTAKWQAQSICREWGKKIGLEDSITTVFFSNKIKGQCAEASLKVDADLEQRRINRIYAYAQNAAETNGIKTNFYINNTEIEKPIYLTDKSEQAQWLQLNDRRFCGFLDSKLALFETPQSLVVRTLDDNREFVYLKVATEGAEEIFQASSRRYLEAEYLVRNGNLKFMNIHKDGTRSEVQSLNMSYRDKKKGQRYCRPFSW